MDVYVGHAKVLFLNKPINTGVFVYATFTQNLYNRFLITWSGFGSLGSITFKGLTDQLAFVFSGKRWGNILSNHAQLAKGVKNYATVAFPVSHFF